MKRRYFLKSAIAGTGVLSLTSFPYHLYAMPGKKYPYDRIKLGNSGIEVSRMAMGTGTRGYKQSSNQTRQLGIEGLADLMHTAYDEGVTFWDSADLYGSHPHLKEALKTIPRGKVVILTKSRARTPEDMKSDLDRFRQEIGTDYIDIILMHGQTSPNWNTERKGVMEVLSEAKEEGKVRMIGISCHSLSALEVAAEEPWLEICLARWNPAGVNMDADVTAVEKVLKKMKANGKTIMGMKVFGEGALVDKKDECLQFQLATEFIDCFTIGVESKDQFNDLLKRIPEASVRA